jgi:alpha-amylase/alpha-mannosidase (GH57 family)
MRIRYICIHGHFYQPPRENPWLEAVETQDSATPYHDWNERITAECYGPNASSRILDARERIVKIVNNYAAISFNFGPTLLSWLEQRQPETYAAILDADRVSRERFGGHGSAIAQAYNHMILPLANARDQRTQVRWGIRDFETRFKRKPEAMWLPETAVDVASLEALAAEGIAFTILEPQQAKRWRAIGEDDWTEQKGAIDPTMPYRCNLPSGRAIDLFFFDGPISRAVAFERLLARGENLAHRLLGAFGEGRTHPQLINIATDGETYGHHHHHGDMALAYALDYINEQKLSRVANYGQFLADVPPTHEVEIAENTAWSCSHGLGRWERDCGCSTGGGEGWNQQWRTPLREALDWLRDECIAIFESRGASLLRDPWDARDDYIDVVLDRSDDSVARFLAKHASTENDRLVLQRHLRHRNRAGAALRRARHSARRKGCRPQSGARVSAPHRLGEEQSSAARRRAADLRAGSEADASRSSPRGRALRRRLALRQFRARRSRLLLSRPAERFRIVPRGTRAHGHRIDHRYLAHHARGSLVRIHCHPPRRD